MRSVLLKSGLVTIAAMMASVVVAAATLAWQGQTITGNALLISFLAPLVIAWPASARNFQQREKLQAAHAEIEKAHRELAESHRMLAEVHARLADRARRDAMTGMLNRESFLQAAERWHRDGAARGLLIVDADHFKAINDTHGHAVGDAALVAIASAITQAAGADAIVGRIGGEEFAVCLSGQHARTDAAVAEAIRSAVAEIPFEGADGAPLKLSVSVGGAVFSPQLTVNQVLRGADKRLYAAKKGGRNTVVTDISAVLAAA